jgi:hypothetical protein
VPRRGSAWCAVTYLLRTDRSPGGSTTLLRQV